mmetsp:Transcript_2597/g.10530  ORF Transcript_2597/g.10530 Transcript_2597/m.10530 type:complete len:128 (-) Transcript_2597:314-697(-)
MNERALVAMNSVLPPPKQGEAITVQLRFIVDGVPNENNKYVEWALVALDGDAFDTKMRNHLEHEYNLKDIDRTRLKGWRQLDPPAPSSAFGVTKGMVRGIISGKFKPSFLGYIAYSRTSATGDFLCC